MIAGNLMHREAVDALAAPTTHASFRAANTVLQPVRCVGFTKSTAWVSVASVCLGRRLVERCRPLQCGSLPAAVPVKSEAPSR